MPITEVTGPDGRLHHIEHPAGALPSQIIKIAQSQIGPGPSKPGAVSNLFRAGLAGASEVGYDTLQFLADETIKFRAGEEATRAKIEAQYGNGASVDERLNEIEERKRERLRKSQSIIGDTGRMSGEAFGVEEGRFSADLGRGFGQLVPLVATRGFSAVPMAFMESRRDAEQTFGLNYADMDNETQRKVDIAAGTYAMFSYGLNRVGLEAMGLNKLDDFLKGSAKIKGSVVKEIFKGGLKGGSGEFITETIEAAAMDQGFSRIYDPDREFSFSDIKDYLYEGFIGSIVGTTAGTGTSTVKALAGDPQSAVEEEGKPTEEGESLEVPRSVEVTYKQIDGKVRVVPIAVSKGQDPLTVAEEVLEGRYDKSQGLIINETFEEQPLDLGDQEAEILEEDVPVDPVPVEQAPTPEPEQAPTALTPTPTPTPAPEPSVETAPESAPDPTAGKTVSELAQEVGITEQNFRETYPDLSRRADERARSTEAEVDPRTGLPGFSLPQNLKKGKPGYRQTQGITFASDLERAAYSATTSTSSEPGKRKRDSYRKLLQDAGYSSTEINTMGREVRSQMRKQYKGPGSELSVALPQDIVAQADPAQAQAKEEPLYEFVDPFNGYPQTSPMTLQEVREAMNDEDSYEKYGVILDSRNMREYRTDEQLEQLGQDVVAEAAPFTAPQKAPLSHVEQSDIIDMDALIDDIVENDIPVWFWYADQLGEGDFNLPSGGSVNLDAGPSFALQPANRAAGRVWASSKSATAINNKISQLKYTDKNGKEQTGYIFLVSGSPDTMFLFNKQAFLTFYQNAFQEKQKDGTFELRDFSDVKKEILASRPTKVVKETLNNHSTLESLMNSAASRPFIEALLAQRGKSTPLAEYLKSKGFFDIENSQLRDGFYKDNNFKLNDVLLVVKPTKAVKEKIAHKTYTTPVYGEVVGVPDKAVDAYLLMPDSVRKNKEITMDPPQAAQVVAPYGARVTTIKKIVGSQQARRAVKKLRKVIEDSPDGFTVDTAGEFATGGYIVAPEKATERVIDKNNFNEESLTQYIIDNKPHLNVEGAMLGGWYDSQNGRYVLDVVFAVDTEQDAVDIAIWGDQDAIFNLDTFTEIRTKDDNKNPTTPQGDTRTASEILSRKPTQNLGEYSSQRRRDSRGVRQAVPGQASPDVTAQAAETAAEDRGPQETFSNINQLEDFISKSFSSIADKMGINIYPNMVGQFVAQYNVTQKIIEYNPRALLNRTKAGVQAAMREEIIHAAMHNVLIQKEKKARTGRSEDALWVDFFTALGNNLTPQERTEIQNVYQSLREGDPVGFGSEYSRAVVQKFRYGDFTEQYIAVDKGGPAFQAIVDLLRSVQAYMAKVLGPMVKTDPEAAQVIVDTVELLNAIDPSIRPKSQQVVANAYNAVDKNTAKENAEKDVAPKDASQRVREERKWWDGKMRSKFSKSLTPIITKLRRINPQFALLFQRLENTIRERSLRYKKQSQPFFNKLNSLNSKDFNELKRLLFFSPTPDEANLPKNRATMQRRDALLHKHGLLNMYRLDVQPILEEIYAQYSELGMPIGYLEDYFPRVVKDLEGLIKSYGYETKRTFGNLVREENARRKEEGLPEMESSERARFFQDFLQNKSNFGPKGVRPPGNVKVREIQTIEPSRLKFYEDPSIAFGNYTTNMVSAIEAYQVLGSTNQAGNKGETGKLGELTERLFQQGLIDEQDASELKSAAELATVQAGQELVPLRELGAATYVFTLIDVGTVLIQFLDLAKVLVLRGPTATAKGVYRTLTGNRVYDIEEDFSIVKKQIMAEFDQEGGTQKLLNLGLRYIVPFQQMDVAMKHATVEATLIDFLKKANAKVGSKPYRQLMTELTIRMGPDAAFKAVQGMRRDTFDKNLPEVKEAVMMELFDRQPLTYLQIPETHRRNPNSRLLYKLKTFMLLDINFNRELALNDLMGPDKTVKQRYKGLKMLVAMMAALTAIGVPKDLLLDFIRGKDTYLSDHVINNMLQVFGLSRYGVGTIFEDGPVDAIVDRFKPAAYSILDGTENDLLAWVKGDREISEFKVWKNLPVFDVWGRFTEDFQEKKRKLYREKRKEGQRPTIRR